MKLYFKYISYVYLKSFLIVFFALESFYVGIDFLNSFKDLPNSANIQILYLFFSALAAIPYMLSLSIVLSMIIAKISMINSSELISFYSLGLSKNLVIMPVFVISLLISLFYVFLNFTSFTYAYDLKRKLLNHSDFTQPTKDIFLKFDDKFIYIKELSNNNEISNIEILDINDSNLLSIIQAKKAFYKNNEWDLMDVNLTSLPEKLILGKEGLKKENFKSFESLHDFKPKSIQNANSKHLSLNIIDSFDYIFTFKDQGIELNHVRANLYYLIIFPFFAPFLLMIFHYYLPVSARFYNLAFISFVLVISSLVFWGMFFISYKLSQNSVISPELAILFPILVLMVFAIVLYKRHC